MSQRSREVRLKVRGLPAQRRFWGCRKRYRAFVGGVGSGKTWAGAIEILRQPARSRGIVLAPTYPMMRDASQQSFFDLCPRFLIKEHHKSKQVTELADGKVIYWRSADKPDGLRGPNLTWAWLDEGAYAKDNVWDIVLGRLRVARYGPTRAWVTTTPNGIENWLYRAFVSANDPEYEVFKAATADNRYNEAGYAQRLARKYGATNFALQELKGEFVDLAGERRLPAHLFTERVYQPRACNLELGLLPQALRFYALTPGDELPNLRIYQLPEPGREYVGGADPAEGVGGDDSALVIKDRGTGQTVAVLAGQYEPEEVFPELIAQVSRFYGDAAVLPERNNHGHAVSSGLKRRGVVVLDGPDGRSGWLTNPASKAQLYDSYASALLEGDVLLHDERVRRQLGVIHRLTLKSPEKGRKPRVDDEATAEVLAHKARELGVFDEWEW